MNLELPLKIWYDRNLILPECRSAPLLMYISPDDTHPELEFWNLLAEKLHEQVDFYPFDELSDAGTLVITLNHLRDASSTEKLKGVNCFERQLVASKRTLAAFSIVKIILENSNFHNRRKQDIPPLLWLYDLKSKVNSIEKPKIPTVGFVGNVNYPGVLNPLSGKTKLPIWLLKNIASRPSSETNLSPILRNFFANKVRRAVLESVRAHPELKTEIIERSKSFLGSSLQEQRTWKQEYIELLNNNAYILCIRGEFNTCFQVYEVLSAGRIPVIIDTEIQLPSLGSFGSWDEFSIRVPLNQLSRLGEIVWKFHQRKSQEEFIKTCEKARAAYKYLLPHHFLVLPNLLC